MNKLNNDWSCWIHYQNDNEWTLESYKHIAKFSYLKEITLFIENLHESIIKKTMVFFMKDTILPLWETEDNIDGGCFSYKISNKDVPQAWKELTYMLVGESMSTNKNFIPLINGITISPKKNFCIVKVWLATCEFRDASIIRELHAITPHGCLFKEHMPEY